jgi:hypothetical protein
MSPSLLSSTKEMQFRLFRRGKRARHFYPELSAIVDLPHAEHSSHILLDYILGHVKADSRAAFCPLGCEIGISHSHKPGLTEGASYVRGVSRVRLCILSFVWYNSPIENQLRDEGEMALPEHARIAVDKIF